MHNSLYNPSSIRRRGTPSPSPAGSTQDWSLPPLSPLPSTTRCARQDYESHNHQEICDSSDEYILPPIRTGRPFGVEGWSEVPLAPTSNARDYNNRRRRRNVSLPPLNPLRQSIQPSRSTLCPAPTYQIACSEDEKTRDDPPSYIPLIPAKFTDKLPKPRFMNYSNRLLLETGDGVGFETPDNWTFHKWCLLFGVTTVFLYGLAGVACALLTWFRSGSTPFPMQWQALTRASMATIGRAPRY